MRQEISSLKKNLEDQINGATKMLAKKSEQIAEFEAEISILRNKILQSVIINVLLLSFLTEKRKS